MKGPRKPRRKHVPFVVYTSETLSVGPHQGTGEGLAAEQPFEIGPSLLLISAAAKRFSVVADALNDWLAIQFIILGAIYSDLAVLADDLEVTQGYIANLIFEQIKGVIGAEDSIRITVEVVFGRYLPYECPQRHAAVSGDMCRDCGVRIGRLGEHLFPLPESPEPTPVGDDVGPGVHRARKANRQVLGA